MPVRKDRVDYSLYLVTDSTPAILGDRDLLAVVADAARGGVTIVQYRDKISDTAVLIATARALHAVTSQYGIPLIINDRVDVALAVGADGVHLGQDDMDFATARRILGPDAIIGVSASTSQEAVTATAAGADYLGIGAVFATPTKEDTKKILGPDGVREVLAAARATNSTIPAVCIGGVNVSNVQRILYQSFAGDSVRGIDGVAVVSAIVTAVEPQATAAVFRRLLREPAPWQSQMSVQRILSAHDFVAQVPPLLTRLAAAKPLCHNMTNTVVQNFAANVALAIGASPIMSLNGAEAEDLATLQGALVVNMGTVTIDSLAAYGAALKAYNERGGPTLFDPVGGGATAVRRAAIRTIMTAGYFDVIKGNESEIRTVLGSDDTVSQRGVDSGDSTTSEVDKGRIVKSLATRERCVVLMTGATDYLSDGRRVLSVSNGHEYLGAITGSGCSLGTTIASVAAVERSDKLLAALAGILLYEIAAERAARREDVLGPGSFVPAFLDELYALRKLNENGDTSWVKIAKVQLIEHG